jgi:hypothetical protein
MQEHVFHHEVQLLEQYKQLDRTPSVDYKSALANLTICYAELLEQTRFITKVSDRLEKKIEIANHDLQTKNAQLQQTLDALTRAQVGKRAMAIIYFVAIILFVLEEFFVEPFINMFGDGMWLGIVIKLSIVLMLKPAEGLLEARLLMLQRKKVAESNQVVLA